MTRSELCSGVTVGVVAKPRQKLALAKAQEVVAWLRTNGVDYRVDADAVKAMPGLEADVSKVIPRQQLTSCCPVIVVLGGDGTLISAARHPVEKAPVILGVNIGTLGFLNEVDAQEMLPTLEAVLQGEAVLELRRLLQVRLKRRDSSSFSYYALNDVVVGKEALARLLGIELLIDGHSAAVIRGDGIIVSTPGGSTAYSLAAGGSIVHPQVDALLVTPVCPHSLSSRPLVIPGDAELVLRVKSNAPEDVDRVYLTIDGQEGTSLITGDEVQLQTSKYAVQLVKSPSKNYFENLSTKLKWASR